MGPMLSCIYTKNLAHLLSRHEADFKLCADDTQIYPSLSNIENTVRKLNRITADVSKWMPIKQLKLNEVKTEWLVVGKTNDVRRLDISSLLINDTTITVKKSGKKLDVTVDRNLTFKDQVKNVVKNAGHHLRKIAFLKKYLDEKTLRRLPHNHVISRLDYCKALHYRLPIY